MSSIVVSASFNHLNNSTVSSTACDLTELFESDKSLDMLDTIGFTAMACGPKLRKAFVIHPMQPDRILGFGSLLVTAEWINRSYIKSNKKCQKQEQTQSPAKRINIQYLQLPPSHYQLQYT